MEEEMPESLPEIQETATVNEVFRELARKKVGAFVLPSNRVIPGVALAEALLARDAGSRSGDLRIRDVIKPSLGFTVAPAQLDALTITNPPVFVCSNPNDPHKNLEWNDGYCSECPYSLEKAQ
jgi:hypothetical protein